MKVLLIEDDDSIRKIIKRALEEDNLYHVEEAEDGKTGLDMAWDEDYSIIILDLMLPELDGLSLCNELRKNKINTPILMLTAKDTIQDKVKGLETGADDYLVKPFHIDELLARVKALIRREGVQKESIITIGDLKLDTNTRQLFKNGQEINLSQREYSLMEILARNENKPVSRETIQYKVWNNEDSLSNTVDVYIRMLRKKIEHKGDERIIHTVHGLGYMLKYPQKQSVGK